MKRFTAEEKTLIEKCLSACLSASFDILVEFNDGRRYSSEQARQAFRNAIAISEILDKLEK